MASNDIPQPPELPEDEGVPDYADDTSTAYDEADRPRFNDSPYPVPADEPQMIDEYGVTAAEQRRGEPLAERLREEEPELTEPAELSEEEQAGRLVEPDEGIRADTEPELFAGETPAASGGLTAEEAAVYEVTEEELPEDEPRNEL